MSTATNIDISKLPEKEINNLREIRKLLDILNKWGNVLVPGGDYAANKLQILVNGFVDQGYSIEDISTLVDELHKAGYPVNQ